MLLLHIVAHIDVDGIVCHTIAEMWARKAQIATKHCFVDYQNIEKALEEVGKSRNKKDELLIADIGYAKELVEILFKECGAFTKRISWFDHHRWDQEAFLRVDSAIKELIVDESLCASEILQKRFLPEDKLAKKLAYLARAHDFYGQGFEPDVYEQACKIQDVITSGYSKEKLVEQLSVGILWNKEFESAFKEYQEIRKEALEKMDSTATSCFAIVDNTKASILAVLVPDVLESKDVRAHLLEKYKDDIVFAIWPNGRIAYEARSEKFLIILQRINEKFNGGGRGLAGGALYPARVNKECFDEIIKALGS
jgi:oligoribonuclease NrnB/cAMP/cGMP phosphodiesterase (DHH superfamily)